MKKCPKGAIPQLLAQYQLENPNESWQQFKNDCQLGFKALQNQVQLDQGNLCCYCEIDTKQGLGKALDDFRIEHFHPKSDPDRREKNWALDWNNLLGCCHGGSDRSVIEGNTRFIEKHFERHSDVLKENYNWDNEILNPLHVPAFPNLFHISRQDGDLSVDLEACLNSNISSEKAQNCLHPEKLNLNSVWLKDRRKEVVDKLNELLQAQLSAGIAIENALETIIAAQLRKNEQGHWPAFFTSIRSYFGKSAENHLRSIDYDG